MTKRQKREKMTFLATLVATWGFLVVWVAVAALIALFWSTTARAQAVCGERKAIVASLEKTYSEAPVSIGLASNGAVIEVFASPSGSFTILLTRPNGLSCVMAAGENWEKLPFRLNGGALSGPSL